MVSTTYAAYWDKIKIQTGLTCRKSVYMQVIPFSFMEV